MEHTYLLAICIFPLCNMKAQRKISCTSTAPPSLNLGTRWRWVVNLPLYSRARTPVPTKQESGLVPEPVSTLSKIEKSFNHVGNRTLRPAYGLFTTLSYWRTGSVSKSTMTLKRRNIGHSSGLTVLRRPWRQERRQNTWFWTWPPPSTYFQFIIQKLHYTQG